MENENKFKWIVCDGNGTFLSKQKNEITTCHLKNIRVFDNIGDALCACADYNKNNVVMRIERLNVIP